MTFILVTLSIMGTSIFLIYKLTNYFGFRMKYRSLFLCAFMAFLVNIAAISMSPYLTRSHYIRLVFLVIAAAAVVTVYNEYLVRHEAVPAEGKASLPREDAPDKPGFMKKLMASVSLAPLQEAITETLSRLRGTIHPAPAGSLQDTAEEPSPLPIPDEAEGEEKAMPKAEAPGQKPEISPVPPRVEAIPEKGRQKPEASPVSEEQPGRSPEPVREPSAEEPQKKAETTAKTPSPGSGNLRSLDDLLDYAYEQKAKQHTEEAILAYRDALEHYGDDAYAPFIVIDLGNIYKETGAYQEAIRTYEEALSLPVIANDDATSAKFRENLAYLRTVRYILSKHNSSKLPFRKIPADYLKEMEAEFQSRQMHS